MDGERTRGAAVGRQEAGRKEEAGGEGRGRRGGEGERARRGGQTKTKAGSKLY
jgi:hypothetical protein